MDISIDTSIDTSESGYDKIKNIIYDIDIDIDNNDLGTLMLDFLKDYEYYGYSVNTNILRLNFSGSSDWCYFISILDEEMKTFKLLLDTYPIYLIKFDIGKITKTHDNYKEFIEQHIFIPENNLRTTTKNQNIPIISKIL
jgi:hypothetical protein